MALEYAPNINLQDIAERKASPIDLIFLKGLDFVGTSLGIQEDHTENEFTHVALVINTEVCPWIHELVKGRLYGLFSVAIGAEVGLAIRDIEELVPAYCATEGAHIAWGRLRDNGWTTFKETPGITVADDPVHRLQKQRDPILQALTHTYKAYCQRERSSPSCLRRGEEKLIGVKNYLQMALLTPNLIPHTVSPIPIGVYTKDFVDQVMNRPISWTVDHLTDLCSEVVYIQTDEIIGSARFN